MPSVLLSGSGGGLVNGFEHGYTSVWVRRSWGDAWTWLPYIRCVRAEAALWPTVPKAEFAYEFGKILREDNSGFGYYYPYELRGAFVKVVGHTFERNVLHL